MFFWPWFDLRNVAQPGVVFNSVCVLGSGVSGDIGAHHTNTTMCLRDHKAAHPCAPAWNDPSRFGGTFSLI